MVFPEHRVRNMAIGRPSCSQRCPETLIDNSHPKREGVMKFNQFSRSNKILLGGIEQD